MYRQQEQEEQEEEADALPTQALSLRWSWGVDERLVQNLSMSGKQACVFFASANTAVIFNKLQNHQFLLQGHRNTISASAVSPDKTWLITGDEGDGTADGSMVIVWDARTAQPARVIDLDRGVRALAFSADGSCFAVLTARGGAKGDGEHEDANQQTLTLYDWTVANDAPPLASCVIPGDDPQHFVCFNSVEVNELATNGARSVIFWSWARGEDGLHAFMPKTGLKKFGKSTGALTQSVFIPYTTRLVSATARGDIVMWDFPTADSSRCREAVKMIKTGSKGSINVLKVVDRYVVTGGKDGCVRFYDFQFRVVGWFEELEAGPIASVSFSESVLPSTAASGLATAKAVDQFTVPDFVVATGDGKVIECQAAAMNARQVERRRGTLLVQSLLGAVVCVEAHPTYSVAALGTARGDVLVWNFNSMNVVVSTAFEAPVHTVCFSPDGGLLVVGLGQGRIEVLSMENAIGSGDDDFGATLDPVESLQAGTAPIHTVRCSEDALWLAAAGVDCCVSLFHYAVPRRRGPNAEIPTEPKWNFIGRHRAHTGAVVGLEFRGMRLFSLGENGLLHEYDLARSSIKHGVRIRTTLEVADVNQPMFLATGALGALVPGCESKEDAVVVGDDQYKMRVLWKGTPEQCARRHAAHEQQQAEAVQRRKAAAAAAGGQLDEDDEDDEQGVDQGGGDDDDDNDGGGGGGDGGEDGDNGAAGKQAPFLEDAIGACALTALEPTFGDPINRLLPVPKHKRAYAGRYAVFSTDGAVMGLMQLPWDGNPARSMALIGHPHSVVDMAVSCDGKSVITVGGRDGTVKVWSVNCPALEASITVAPQGIAPFVDMLGDAAFRKELKDLFCFCQLRQQGLQTARPRQITGRVSNGQVVHLMRAVGVFLTERQARDLESELEFLGQGSVDVDTFTQLYVNHRHHDPVNQEDIEEAFRVLGGEPIDTEELVHALETAGEAMTRDEVLRCLQVLLGAEEPQVPESFTARQFAEDLLQLEEEEEDEEDEDEEEEHGNNELVV